MSTANIVSARSNAAPAVESIMRTTWKSNKSFFIDLFLNHGTISYEEDAKAVLEEEVLQQVHSQKDAFWLQQNRRPLQTWWQV